MVNVFLTGEILWYEHCESTPRNSDQSTQHFGELANALQLLHHYKQEWTAKRPKIGFQDQLLLNVGQKYCRMLQETQNPHSAVLLF